MLKTFEQFENQMNSESNPPNYQEAQGDKNCGNCGAFKTMEESGQGWCEMFNVNVESNYVCDDWMDKQEWQQHK